MVMMFDAQRFVRVVGYKEWLRKPRLPVHYDITFAHHLHYDITVTNHLHHHVATTEHLHNHDPGSSLYLADDNHHDLRAAVVGLQLWLVSIPFRLPADLSFLCDVSDNDHDDDDHAPRPIVDHLRGRAQHAFAVVSTTPGRPPLRAVCHLQQPVRRLLPVARSWLGM